MPANAVYWRSRHTPECSITVTRNRACRSVKPNSTMALTRSSAVIGTPRWRSPDRTASRRFERWIRGKWRTQTGSPPHRERLGSGASRPRYPRGPIDHRHRRTRCGHRELHVPVGVRQVVIVGPFLDLRIVAIGPAVVVGASTIAFLQELLILALQLVVQDDAFDLGAPFVEALGFALVRAVSRRADPTENRQTIGSRSTCHRLDLYCARHVLGFRVKPRRHLLLALVIGRQVRTDHRPRLASVGTLVNVLAADVNLPRIMRRHR